MIPAPKSEQQPEDDDHEMDVDEEDDAAAKEYTKFLDTVQNYFIEHADDFKPPARAPGAPPPSNPTAGAKIASSATGISVRKDSKESIRSNPDQTANSTTSFFSNLLAKPAPKRHKTGKDDQH